MDSELQIPRPSPPPVERPNYRGDAGGYYAVYIKMWVLTLMTAGVYRFWGRTELRRYMWSHIKIGNEPFAYLGRGGELFKSAIKFVILLFLPGLVLGLVSTILFHGKIKAIDMAVQILIGVILYIFFYAAKFMGLRYRMARTSWRGIRFELRGSAKAYTALRTKNLILNILTLGLYRPIGDVEVLKFVVNKCHFGSLAFCYRGTAEELQKIYYICWLLFLPTMGLSLYWYKAKYLAHVAKHTTLGQMQFRLKFEGWEYAFLIISNWMLIVFTLGLAYPFVVHRRVKAYLDRTRFRGTIDENAIEQARLSQGSEGAELSLGFDDFGF